MKADTAKKWQISVEGDFRLCSLVTIIKAAYLTLFRLMGYPYALSTAGLSVGYYMLGRFYRENHAKSVSEAKESARRYFQPYVHMMRPIEKVGGERPLGTIEDHRAMVCFGSSGRPFGLIVCVRTNDKLHGVLMPAFAHPDSVEAYHNFLTNDRESLRTCECVYDPKKDCWEGTDQPIEAMWPKHDDTFEIA
jgi:hypothetical protein